MPYFEIEVEICLGFSHSGGVYNSAYGDLELSDDEVNQLVDLMRKKDSSDIEELNLKEELPEIYSKLDDAYREAALKADEEHWLDEGWYHAECHNYDDQEMIQYLKDHDAWDFQYDEEDFLDEEGKLDEEALLDAECEYLNEEALEDYLNSLDGEERYDFLRNQIGIVVDAVAGDYEVEIPSEIISLAFPVLIFPNQG